jgi:hypothetical protein
MIAAARLCMPIHGSSFTRKIASLRQLPIDLISGWFGGPIGQAPSIHKLSESLTLWIPPLGFARLLTNGKITGSYPNG